MQEISMDYNAESADGRFFARSARLPALNLGDVVATRDEDDNTLRMTVDEFDRANGLVFFVPQWDTWVDGGSDALTAWSVFLSTSAAIAIGVQHIAQEDSSVAVLVRAGAAIEVVQDRNVTFQGPEAGIGFAFRESERR